MKSNAYIVGIDEVGRGPLAGPVTVAAVALPRDFRFLTKIELRDSKKLSAKQRERWCAFIKNHPKIFYATASVYPKMIDRVNISKAANLAATRALKRLIAKRKLQIGKILLDGGLYLPQSISDKRFAICTVIRGDEKYNCIKLASIVAKVKRDRIMKRNHKKYPEYGFAAHKGYGTKAHIKAIKQYGVCPLHRLTFLRNYLNIVMK